MKNKAFYLVAFLLISFLSPVRAGEQISVEPASLAKSGSQPSDFTMIVEGSGKVTAKPKAVFTVGGHYEGMQLPYLISTPKPIKYPRWAIRQGWSGKLVLAIEVFTDGKVGKYKVMESTGYQMLDKAGIESVKTWLFHPAMKDGQPVHTCVQIPILFDLQSE